MGVPPLHGRAKGVGIGWVGGGAVFSTLQAQLRGLPKIELEAIEYPALLLLQVPGAPAAHSGGVSETVAPLN